MRYEHPHPHSLERFVDDCGAGPRARELRPHDGDEVALERGERRRVSPRAPERQVEVGRVNRLPVRSHCGEVRRERALR